MFIFSFHLGKSNYFYRINNSRTRMGDCGYSHISYKWIAYFNWSWSKTTCWKLWLGFRACNKCWWLCIYSFTCKLNKIETNWLKLIILPNKNRMWRKTRQPHPYLKMCVGADPNRNFDFHHAGINRDNSIWFYQSYIFTIYRGWCIEKSLFRNLCWSKTIFRAGNSGSLRICENFREFEIIHLISFIWTITSISICESNYYFYFHMWVQAFRSAYSISYSYL